MNAIIKDIDISTRSPVSLCPIHDVHIGHIGHDHKYFTNVIKWIKNTNTYVVLLGDHIDAISQQDRRFENPTIDPRFREHLDNLHYEQTRFFIDAMKPIEDRIIAILPGNHEIAVRNRFSYDATKVISDELGVPILTDPGYVILKFHRSKTSTLQKNILCSHGGFMGGRKRGSKVNAMEDLAASFDADIYIAGHTHDKFVTQRNIIRPNSRGVLSYDKKLFVNGGSMLHTYTLNTSDDGWATRKLFSPGVPGMMRIDFLLKEKQGKNYIDVHVRE